MLGLYLGSFLLGGIVLVASLALGGSHDGHAAPDGHPAPDAHGGSGPGQLWVLFVSMRFWTFFAAAFGLTGLLLELWGAIPSPIIALVALCDGLGVGLAVALMFKRLRTDVVTGEVGLSHVIGQEGRVLVPIRPGDLGKIVVLTEGGRIELPARTRDQKVIDPGATVLVAHVEGGIAEVTALESDASARD